MSYFLNAIQFLYGYVYIYIFNFYNDVLVSAIQQRKSAIIILTFPPSLAPSPPPISPSRSSQRATLGFLCYTVTSHQLSTLRLIVYIYVDANFSISLNLSLPYCVYKSTLYICVSVSSLQTGSE